MQEQDKIDRRLARRQAADRRRRQEAMLLEDLLDDYAYGHTRRRQS